jgi:uncharacterized protein (TIGR03435 family)
LAFVLGALGLVSIAGAQQKTPSKELEFEVASIRPAAMEPPIRGRLFLKPSSNLAPESGLFSAKTMFLDYLNFAYDIRDSNEWMPIANSLPSWVNANFWDIEARSEGIPTRAQLWLMMQSLLKTRFKLVVHYENRMRPVYALTLIKPGQPGPGLKRHTSQKSCSTIRSSEAGAARNDDKEPLYCGGLAWGDHGQVHYAISDVSMDEAASFLGGNSGADRSVVNQTGLSGRYDIHIAFDKGESLSGEEWQEYAHDRIREALKKELGLKLVPTTAELPRLVLDHIEKPTPN